MLKFGLAALFVLVVLLVPGYLYLDAFAAQIGFFALIIAALAAKTSLRRVGAELKLFLPFVLLMLGIYAIFGLIGLQQAQHPQEAALTFWLRYGVNRILCFLSTVLALSFVVSFFRIDDALALPLPLSCRKSLILGESLFNTARGALDDSDLYLRHFPDQRILPDRWPARAFAAFQRQLLIILTLIFYILNEAEIQGELIDNRIAHCMKQDT